MNKNVGYCMRSDDRTQQNTMVIVKEVSAEYRTNVRDPETPRDSGWPTRGTKESAETLLELVPQPQAPNHTHKDN